MSSFVVSNKFFLSRGELCITLGTHDNALIDIFHNFVSDDTITIGTDRTLIEKVCEVGTREAGCLSGNAFEINIFSQLLVASMDTQNLLTTSDTWESHLNLTIKATWAKKSLIKNIHSVSGCDNHNTSIIVKAIHLSKKLVNSLFAFIIGWLTTSTALLTDGVNFVNEDNTRLIFASNFKEIADPFGAHTDKLFNKVGGGALDEWDI